MREQADEPQPEEGVALAPGGPYLLAALICERILEEKDGTKTLMRVLDWVHRYAYGPTSREEMEPFEFNIALYLKFRCGKVSGPRQVRIAVERPDGSVQVLGNFPVGFDEGEARVVEFAFPLTFRFEIPGLYWFKVYFEEGDLLAARVPLRVQYFRYGSS